MLTADLRIDDLLRKAHAELGAGKLAHAQATCIRALSLVPNHPRAMSLLGQTLFAQDKHDEAVRVFNAVTVLEPAVAQHWQNLAAALRPTKQYDRAIAAFDKALRLGPPSATLLYNLGVLQMERCDYNAAYLALRDAVKLAPSDAKSRWGFAQCCYDIIALEESLETLKNWQHFAGLDVDLTVRIVFLLVMMGATEQALPGLHTLQANPPTGGAAAVRFATVLERLHRLEEASAISRRLQHDRSLETDADRLLMSGVLAERKGDLEGARRDFKFALQQQTEPLHQYHLLFRLAKIEDALGNFAAAFTIAEDAHRSQVDYIARAVGKTPVEDSKILTRAERGCDPADLSEWDLDVPSRQDSPVFVVGFPRSGTTLLEQVLDAHPALRSMDEQPFILRAHEEVLQLPIRYPDQLGRLKAAELQELRSRYWLRVKDKVSMAPGQRLVDKNPLNLNLVPLIHRLFPNASIILTIRHPCDVLLSCFMQNFRAPALALLCRDLPALAHAYNAVFGFWYSQSSILRLSTHELHYERLTADFDGEVARLAEFLELPLHPAMLTPAEHARTKGFVSTPSYAQILEPVNRKSVGRWQNYREHFEPILPTLRPWLERWGYAGSDLS